MQDGVVLPPSFQPKQQATDDDGSWSDESFESSSNQNTPKKTPLNLAIPAGGIDADISDTLSVKSWGLSLCHVPWAL